MSSIKYATEDNIRYLIMLIKDELNNYVTDDEFRLEIDKLSSLDFSLSFEKVQNLPNKGEPNVIYIVPNGKSENNNVYDEYFWYEEDQKFELFGSTETSDTNVDKIISNEEIDKLF